MKTFERISVATLLSLTFVISAQSQGKKQAPSPSASTPTASSGASSSGAFEPQMLAFGGLNLVAANIANTVCSKTPNNSTIVIYDQSAFASIQAYEAFIANLRVIAASYNNLIPTPPKPSTEDKTYGIGASSTIDPFSDATSLLSAIAVSSNIETPSSFTISDSSVALALAKSFDDNSTCKSRIDGLIYPPLFGSGSSSDYSSAYIQKELRKLNLFRRRARETLQAQNEDYLKNHPKTTATGDPILNSAFSDVNGLYDTFINSLLQVNPSSGSTGSAAVIQGYQLAVVLRGAQQVQKDKDGKDVKDAEGNPVMVYKPAYILLASIASDGGTVHDHKSFWTALGSGDKITYSGGLVVNVALWRSSDKKPIYADVLRYRTPFDQLDSPTNTTNVNKSDNLQP